MLLLKTCDMYHRLWRKQTRGCYFTLLFRKTAICVWPVWRIRLRCLHSKCKAKRGKSSRIYLPSVSVQEPLPHSMYDTLLRGSGSMEISFRACFHQCGPDRAVPPFEQGDPHQACEMKCKTVFIIFIFIIVLFCFWRSVSDLCDIIKPSL